MLPSEVRLAAMALQPDGQIVIAGQQLGLSPASNYAIRVLRFKADGDIDASFGTSGRVELDFGTGYEAASDVVVDPAGEILITGRLKNKGAVIGLLPDGSVDMSFGDAGALEVGEGSAEAIEPYPGGGYLVAGTQRLTKITEGGEVDASYGDSGTSAAIVPGSGLTDFAVRFDGTAAAVATVSTYVTHGSVTVPAIAIVDPNGEAVSGFEEALTLADAGLSESISGAMWDTSGGLIITGSQTFQSYPFGGFSEALIARFSDAGGLDTSFTGGGRGLYPSKFSTFPCCGIADPVAQSDGRIVASAGTRLVRFRSAGGIDDADADLRPDQNDQCPRRYAPTRDGCVHLAVSVKLRRAKVGFAGTVDAERDCLRRSSEGEPFFFKVRLMRVKKGRDRVAGADVLDRRGKFSFAKALRGGRYYVRVKQRLRPSLVLCKGASSRALIAG